MLPVVAEIIHVFEPFVRLEAKVRESDLIGIIGEADAALVSDTILLSVNDKPVQMAICPTHDHLHGFVKCPDGRVMRNQDASPNCWLDVSQDYLELIHSQRQMRVHRLRLLRHVTLRVSNPAIRHFKNERKSLNLAINAQPLEKVKLATLPDSYSSAQS